MSLILKHTLTASAYYYRLRHIRVAHTGNANQSTFSLQISVLYSQCCFWYSRRASVQMHVHTHTTHTHKHTHTHTRTTCIPSTPSNSQKLNPLKMLRIHGRSMKVHVDAAMAAAGDAPSTMSVAMSGYEVERSNWRLCHP